MLLILLSLLFPLANANTWDQLISLYEKGEYRSFLSASENLADNQQKGRSHFYRAMAWSKLQNYDSAIEEFAQAQALQYSIPEFAYNYGQSLFAAQKFALAQKQFKKSIVSNFKVGASAYYIAYIAQILEERDLSKDFYSRILLLKDDKDGVKQAALLQLAELEFSEAQAIPEKDKKYAALEKNLISFTVARDFSPETGSADQADRRLNEVNALLDSLSPKMRNGNPIPRRPFSLRLSSDFEWDSNVVTKADNTAIEISDADSFILRPSIFAKYFTNTNDRFSISPELNLTSDFHSRRSTPGVYQNDSITAAPALRSKWEHWIAQKPASALFDIESSLMYRDFQKTHSYRYYNKYLNVVLGERASLFSASPTTIKFGYKFYTSQDTNRDSYTPSVSINQSVALVGLSWQNTWSADWVLSRNSFYDERNYRMKISTYLPKAIGAWNASPALNITLKELINQRATRGNETNLNPSIDFNKTLQSKLELSAKYAFTRNWSKDRGSYQYRKHVITFNIARQF